MVRKFKGTAAAPGIAIATIVQFHSTLDQIPTRKLEPEEVAAEKERLTQGVSTVNENLADLQKQLGPSLTSRDSGIFAAQQSIVYDPDFRAKIEAEVDKLVNLERAIQQVVAEYEQAFLKTENAAMRERAADIRDVGRQLVSAVMATERRRYTADGCDYLFAADEFLPSDAGRLDPDHIRGIVTSEGGKYSHGAILSRSLGIPAVVGVENLMLEATTGTMAIVDGDAGVVLLNPGPAELKHYQRLQAEQRVIEGRLAEIRLQPSVTTDGVEVELYANAESVHDLSSFDTEEIAGVGLFRTEFAFMERTQFPTEDEQVAMYGRAIELANGKPVTFRTLDVGGDKPLDYFKIPPEHNPVLGWRGIRLCLDWPDILYTQMRAILRAAAKGPARILLPMITARSEIDRCRVVLDQLSEDLKASGIPHDGKVEFGVMIEVPVLVPVLPDILPLVDFVSVGTNDLVQYLLAVDRDNVRVSKMYDPFHPGVLRVLRDIAAVTRAAGKPLSVCGEIAGDHWFTPLLVGLGFRELSMAPVFLRRVKFMLRSFTVAECERFAERALAMQSTAAVRKLVEDEIQVRWTRFLAETTETEEESAP